MTFAVVNIVVSLVLGAAVVFVGMWGRRHMVELVPAALPADERAKRVRVMRRGALACQVVGVLFAAASVVTTLW